MNKTSGMHEEPKFFILQDVPPNLYPKLAPLAQLLNLETIDVSALRELIRVGLP